MSTEELNYQELYKLEVEKNSVLNSKVERLEKEIIILKGLKIKEKKIYKTKKDEQAAVIQVFYRRWMYRKKFRKVVFDFIKSPQAKKLKERNKLISEIIKTEETYVNGLTDTIKHYLEPLKKHSLEAKKKMITHSEVKLIFSNVEQLLMTHNVFLNSLRQRLENWPHTRIGDCFYNQVSFLNFILPSN